MVAMLVLMIFFDTCWYKMNTVAAIIVNAAAEYSIYFFTELLILLSILIHPLSFPYKKQKRAFNKNRSLAIDYYCKSSEL